MTRASVGGDRPETISPADPFQEEIADHDRPLDREVHHENSVEVRLAGDPGSVLPAPEPDERLVDEDLPDPAPVGAKFLRERSEPLDPLPYRDVAPVDDRIQAPGCQPQAP
jgi:hypothetical protein